MGHEQIQTPHIDKLAAQSLTFTRGYVPESLCRPSLASIITGLYPHQHGIVGNDPPGRTKENRLAYLATWRTSIARRSCPPCCKRPAISVFNPASGGKETIRAGASRTG
jgi:arylsulfatase A-like enzyme